MVKTVEEYLIRGCLRCPLGDTPDCKVHTWKDELVALRAIVLKCGLTETIKWGVPCYTINNHNVLMVSAFKDYCALSFFKGALLKDEGDLLHSPGEFSQATRLFKFTDVKQITEIKNNIEAYIYEAKEVEKAGLKITFNKNPEPIPEELQSKMDEDPVFRSAFESLTPGRQRGYIIHFSQPKQSKTRSARIEKWSEKILSGEGMHDAYRAKVKSVKK